MNRYIIIQNNGKLLESDIFFIGNSSKRDQQGKIGFFGSGWKYALAYFMRNGMTPIIYSGHDQITIDTNMVVDGRGKTIEAITINGKESSITVDMGPKWTAYMALREMISNAIDEGGNKFTVDYALPELQEDKTFIILPARHELCNVIDKYDDYFTFNRKPIYECKQFKLFRTPEVRKSMFYRKGILCFEDNEQDFGFDFDFNDIAINEDRLASLHSIRAIIRDAVKSITNDMVWRGVLLAKNNEMLYYDYIPHSLTAIKELIKDGYKFVPNARWHLDDELQIPLPSKWYFALISLGIIDDDTSFFFGDNEFFLEHGFEFECQIVKEMVNQFTTVDDVMHGKLNTSGIFNIVRFQYNKENNRVFVRTNTIKNLCFVDGDETKPLPVTDKIANLKRLAVDIVCTNEFYKETIFQQIKSS